MDAFSSEGTSRLGVIPVVKPVLCIVEYMYGIHILIIRLDIHMHTHTYIYIYASVHNTTYKFYVLHVLPPPSVCQHLNKASRRHHVGR